MNRSMLGACTAVFILGSVAVCLGEDIPWKAFNGTAKSQESVAPGDLKAELSTVQYARVVKPIETRIDMATKAMEPYEAEMQKPEEKRRQSVLVKCKTRSAEYYLAASYSAKKAARLVGKDSLKAALKEQYEEPNKQKAIDIYLELALDVHTGGNLRAAVYYYKKILSIDPENADAKEALTKLAEQYRQAMKDAKKSGSKGGGKDGKEHSWDNEDWKGTGRGDYGDYGNWRNYSGGVW